MCVENLHVVLTLQKKEILEIYLSFLASKDYCSSLHDLPGLYGVAICPVELLGIELQARLKYNFPWNL